MRRRRAWATDDEGSAALEFITVGVILLVPLVYLVLVLGTVQERAFGVEAAARLTARTIALAPTPDVVAGRNDAVLSGILAEYGMDADDVQVGVRCAPSGPSCPAAGAIVTVTVTTRVPMPFVPPVLGLDHAASIPVEASASQKVSRMWRG